MSGVGRKKSLPRTWYSALRTAGRDAPLRQREQVCWGKNRDAMKLWEFSEAMVERRCSDASPPASVSSPVVAHGCGASDGAAAGLGPLRRQHRENNQWRADSLGSVTRADSFAVWIGCRTGTGCCRRLHTSPPTSSLAQQRATVCVRRHLVKRSRISRLAYLLAPACTAFDCEANAMVSTGQFASVMMRYVICSGTCDASSDAWRTPSTIIFALCSRA